MTLSDLDKTGEIIFKENCSVRTFLQLPHFILVSKVSERENIEKIKSIKFIKKSRKTEQEQKTLITASL